MANEITTAEVVQLMSEKARFIRVLDNSAKLAMEKFMVTGDVSILDHEHKDACAKVGAAMKEFNELHKKYLDEGHKFYVHRDGYTAVPLKVLAA